MLGWELNLPTSIHVDLKSPRAARAVALSPCEVLKATEPDKAAPGAPGASTLAAQRRRVGRE